jgi:hypothetical protein
MRTLPPNKTAKSAKRRICLTLLGVLVVFGVSAYAVFAAGGKADFSLAASPGSQTVSAGQAATYTVTITRSNGFSGSVTMTASSLPTGATATWKLADGTSSNVIPPSQNTATLKIQTSSSTQNKTYYPIITGTSGNLSHSTVVTLIVQPSTQPNFTVSAAPASQTVLQGDATTYTVTITRQDGFTGTVNLGVSGVPSGATASWSPSSSVPGSNSTATLRIDTTSSVSPNTYNLAIVGSGTINGSTVYRFAAVTLVVQETKSFRISGNLNGSLAPGRTLPLNLSLNNPYNFTLNVTNIAVAIEEGTGNQGCSGTQNFRIRQIPASRYPISIPAGQTKTLSELGVSDADKPQVGMIDQPWNQDACKGVTVHLSYNGSAGK